MTIHEARKILGASATKKPRSSALRFARAAARRSGMVLQRFRRLHNDSELGAEWISLGVHGGFVKVFSPMRSDLVDDSAELIIRNYGGRRFEIRIVKP